MLYNILSIVFLKRFDQMVLATEAFWEKSFHMFVGSRGILKPSWDRDLYWYMLYIIISIIILILLTGFYIRHLLHIECYLVPFHHITLKRWKEWYCVFYFTLIACIRIWNIVIFTICMPFRLSKTTEQL